MPNYHVKLSRTAEKELARLPLQIQERVINAIDLLSENPRRIGSKKLHGSLQAYRFRIGDYRIIYEINDKAKVVDIAYIRHRREAYD